MGSINHVEVTEKPKHESAEPIVVIIVLGIAIVTLAGLIFAIYWYKNRETKYHRIRKSSRMKPKLKITLPNGNSIDTSSEKVIKGDSLPSLTNVHQDNFQNPPVTPETPVTPNTPYSLDSNVSKYLFNRSISTPAERVFVSKDKDADGLWRTAVKKAAATQFLTTKPKIERIISHCANGKIKFSLRYNLLGQKELDIKVGD